MNVVYSLKKKKQFVTSNLNIIPSLCKYNLVGRDILYSHYFIV